MTESLRETLSALLDDEAHELELRRVLAHSDDPDLRRCWGDYNRQQQVLHGEHDERFAGWDISVSVSAALAEENIPSSRWREWLRPVSGVAVAAGVAAVVVLGARSLEGFGPTVVHSGTASVAVSRFSPSSGKGDVGAVTANATFSDNVPTFSGSSEAVEKARFEYYLRRHTERAALNNGQGMLTYARVVGHEAE